MLFLDVDGPLVPFGATVVTHPGGYPTFPPAPPHDHPLLARVDPSIGPRLLAMRCELVWATTWMGEANECVAPRLGLPPLPFVDWPPPTEEEAFDERAGLHWKTRALSAWAAGRRFAWVDDEITDIDRRWMSAHHPEPTLLHRVDPRLGLRGADLTALEAWLTEDVPV